MIEPGEKIEIEVGGETFDCVVLKRSEQRRLVQLLRKLSTLEEDMDSIESVYDIADEVMSMCLPNFSLDQREKMNNKLIFDISSKLLVLLSLDGAAQKKSESPHSSSAECCANHAVPSVQE